MSEIKGQLLAMLLLLAAFGVVGGVMYSALTTTGSNIENYVSGGYAMDDGKKIAEIQTYSFLG